VAPVDDERFLSSLGQQIKAHWQKHRPTMYAALQRSGRLPESLLAAQDLTTDALEHLLRQGVPYDQAWEAVREQWAFLPDEEDQPTLGFDPATLSQQQLP
jgi:hypothetical protein